MCELKFFLEGLECCKDTQMKACITKLTAELKSIAGYRNKLLCWSFSWAWLPEAHRYGKSNLLCKDRWA